MSEEPIGQATEPTPISASVARSTAWSDAMVAALVGVGFGMTMAQRPILWLLAVGTLFVATILYAVIRIGMRKQRPVGLAPAARTAHGVRVAILFLLAFGITRLVPPPEYRLAYAVTGAVVIGLGGFLVLRLEAAALARELRREDAGGAEQHGR